MLPHELKEWRKSAGLSQSDLAEFLGLSLRQVQDIENGNSPLRSLHQTAINYISMMVAAADKDGTLLTLPATRLVLDLEPLLTLEVRARVRRDALPDLTIHERSLVDAWAGAMGQLPSDEQIQAFIKNVRAMNREREARDQPTWND